MRIIFYSTGQVEYEVTASAKSLAAHENWATLKAIDGTTEVVRIGLIGGAHYGPRKWHLFLVWLWIFVKGSTFDRNTYPLIKMTIRLIDATTEVMVAVQSKP